MMADIKRLARERSRFSAAAAFFIGFAAVWLYLSRCGTEETFFDSAAYNAMGQFFLDNGFFNWKAYAAQYGEDWRGYLFGWIDGFRGLGGYHLFASLAAAGICTLLLPALMERVFHVKMGIWRRWIILALCCILYKGLLDYPLTDIWAAGFGMLCVYAMLACTAKEPLPVAARVLWGFVFGLSLSAAYNLRPVYIILFAAVPCLLVLLFRCHAPTPAGKAGVALASLCGFLLVAAPQMYVNWLCHQNPTFMIISGAGSDLFVNQLYCGIYTMKYETVVGPGVSSPSVYYLDSVGQALLANEGMASDLAYGYGTLYLKSIGGYVRLALHYPLDFMGIYMRHLINMVDIRYPEIFIRDFSQANALYPILNYTTLYAAIVTLWRQFLNPAWKERKTAYALILLLLPTVAIIPGAVETRFSVMLLLLLWGALMCLFRKELFRSITAGGWVGIAVGFVLFFCVMCTVGGSTMTAGELPKLYWTRLSLF